MPIFRGQIGRIRTWVWRPLFWTVLIDLGHSAFSAHISRGNYRGVGSIISNTIDTTGSAAPRIATQHTYIHTYIHT
ncbi:hypothetical protein BX600DRAFT_448670 [Xylariales sp. PMI_506]|nr:hypothetical protein BX600DRAFT_448670 [Xylariales sp. PMI_506]